MIVRQTLEGWEVIYHRAHALLAAKLASAWKPSAVPGRIAEVVAAVSHHDDLEREWKGGHRTPAGAPRDFTLDVGLDAPALRGLIDSALYRGRFVAVLTAMHVRFLLDEAKRDSQEAAEVDAEAARLVKRLSADLGISAADASRAYALVQWCDRLSLVLCRGELPDRGRRLEITAGPDGRSYSVRSPAEGEVRVSPWPFASRRVTVDVEAAALRGAAFGSDEELTTALRSAEVVTRVWNLAPEERRGVRPSAGGRAHNRSAVKGAGGVSA